MTDHTAPATINNTVIGENEFKISRQDLGKQGPIGRFQVDSRIDCCAVSEGFVMWAGTMLYDLDLTRDEKRDFPRLISTGEAFLSSGSITVPVYLPNCGSQVWFLQCAVMPYSNLKIFDDEDPDNSETGWFDILLGQNYLSKMEELKETPGGTVASFVEVPQDSTDTEVKIN